PGGRAMKLAPRHLHHPKEIGVPKPLGRLGISILELRDPDPDRRGRSHGRTPSDGDIHAADQPSERRPQRLPGSYDDWPANGSVARAPKKLVGDLTRFDELNGSLSYDICQGRWIWLSQSGSFPVRGRAASRWTYGDLGDPIDDGGNACDYSGRLAARSLVWA